LATAARVSFGRNFSGSKKTERRDIEPAWIAAIKNETHHFYVAIVGAAHSHQTTPFYCLSVRGLRQKSKGFFLAVRKVTDGRQLPTQDSRVSLGSVHMAQASPPQCDF